ncbi:MAG: 5-carboxymethyl-2-hydroxymuconate semialdehyde dehydrogenase [Paracoccaceae bacterium]
MSKLEANLKKLAPLLEQYSHRPVLNHINGQDVPARSENWFDVHSPINHSRIATAPRSDAKDVAMAATAAKLAFPKWRDMPAEKRKHILHAIADAINERAEEIGLLEAWDTGQPLRFVANTAERSSANFRFFADKVPAANDGQFLPSSKLMNITTRVPIGPVGIITPWNTPFMLATWKIAPALAAGCTVVLKPAEFAPVTARLLMDICIDCGLPPGVLNLVNGMGEEAGCALTQNRDIRAIAFVGEGATGSAIMAQGAPTLKRVHFELGGKNPILVFEDGDMDRALDAALLSIYALNGQRCTSSSRLLVQDSIADEFETRLAERAASIKVGHPLDPTTEVGPLIHATHFKKVMSYIKAGQRAGAILTTGGVPVGADDALCISPALFTQATNDMSIARDEIFGPVLTSIRFSTEQEAIEIANDTDYGLTGYVWTNDLTRALRVTNALDAGMIWVNSENVRHLPAPFGGMKSSGIGRDGGDWSFDFYMEQKMVGFATSAHAISRMGTQSS